MAISSSAQQNLLDRFDQMAASSTPRQAIDRTSHNDDTAEDLRNSHADRAEREQLMSNSQLRRHVCGPWCSCRCHTYSSYRLPWALRSIIGDLRVRYLSQIPECNERSCKRSASAGLSAEYRFPSYVVKRYLVLKVHNGVCDGMNVSLRIPRVTPWGNLLWFYTQNGEELAVQQLFSQGRASPYDINEQGSNALIYARDNLKLVKLLLREKADPYFSNEYGVTPAEALWERAFAGRLGPKGPTMIASMLQQQDYTEARKFDLLHKIVLGLSLRDLRTELQESTANINARDYKERTPLMWATLRDDLCAVRALLDFGADVNARDCHGHSPLDFAHNAVICKLLLDKNANIASRDLTHGRSALHHVCSGMASTDPSNADVDVVDLLVDAGIGVNIQDWDEETPLLEAVFGGLLNHAERLLRYGADPNICNRSSRDDAMHVAVTLSRHKIIPSLLRKHADYAAISKHGRNIAHMAARYATTETIHVLTNSKLVGLDTNVYDEDGMTPADYIANRVVFHANEAGVKEAFATFIKSVKAETTSKTQSAEVSEISKEMSMPGMYPD